MRHEIAVGKDFVKTETGDFMGFLVCIKKKRTANILACGNALESLTMAAVVCKAAAEKIEKEKGICKEEAEKFVIEAIKNEKGLLI